MIVVKIELHNANTGEVSEIGRMNVCNIGGSHRLGSYSVEVERDTFFGAPRLTSKFGDYPRLAKPVWSLVAHALAAVGFVVREDDT